MDITRIFKQTHRQESGTTMLETAIVLPVLLVMLFGIIESGILFGRFLTVTNAAREGARIAIVFQPTCDATQVENSVRATVKAYTSSAGITTNDGEVSILGACTGPDNSATVTVNHAYNYRVLDALAPALSSPVNVSGSSTMRNE